MSEFTFIDLFAGIGGMRIAFQNAGGKCVFSSEWDTKAKETYKAYFGETPEGDICKVDSSIIPQHNILLAGFPCQPFSLAGVSKKNSLGRAHGFEDKTQGTLFFEIARILSDKQPDAFLLENVKNLRSHDKGRTFKVILDVLENELNYKVYYDILDAKGLVPQHRERIYIIGFKKDIPFKFPVLPEKGPTLRSILQKKVDPRYTLSDNLWTYLKNYADKHREKGNGFGFGIADPDGYTRTLSARYHKDGSEILIAQKGKNPRRLTPVECARLQGFPNDFIKRVVDKKVVSDTAVYKQFGNSVAIPVVQAIAEEMIKTLRNNGVMFNQFPEDQIDRIVLAETAAAVG